MNCSLVLFMLTSFHGTATDKLTSQIEQLGGSVVKGAQTWDFEEISFQFKDAVTDDVSERPN